MTAHEDTTGRTVGTGAEETDDTTERTVGTGTGADVDETDGATERTVGTGADETVDPTERTVGTGPDATTERTVGTVAVLIGPPGAGKSTVGQVLADRLGVPFHDSDRAIEQAQDREISDIFVDEGEAYFRALERTEVVRALREETGVLALGGGAVMQEEVAQALRESGSAVVFLDVTIADASRRIGFDASRPLLLINPRASWTRMMNARRPTYQELATIQVSTGGKEPDEVADEVMGALDRSGTP